MPLSVRRARQVDYALLPSIERDAAQIFRAHGLDDVAQMEPSGVEVYDRLPEKAAVFVAEDDRQCIIGFAVVTEIDGEAYLKEISVRRAASGKGAGRMLLNQTLAWAAKHYRWMVLTTFADIPFNAPFYRKAGFEVFAPDSAWAELLALRDEERRRDLDKWPRVTMRRRTQQ